MPAKLSSANAIAEVNNALNNILKPYLNPLLEPAGETSIDIRFDLPDVNSSQSTPAVSVFLYDVHEDLQLRQSEPVRMNISNGTLRAGRVNINCNYLITYWDAQSAGKDGTGPDSGPDNQAVRVINAILQALLNNRELEGVPGAYTRIIPPQENLNSLGNFWHALGNHPRLSLMYSITVPILLDNSLPQPLIKEISSDIIQTPAINSDELNKLLWQTLCKALGAGAEQQLARVEVKSQQQVGGENNDSALSVSIAVSGPVNNENKATLEAELQKWQGSADAVMEINGAAVHITQVDTDGLIFI